MNRKMEGFKKEEFVKLHNVLNSLRNSDQGSSIFILAIYLFWLKSGLTLIILYFFQELIKRQLLHFSTFNHKQMFVDT
jgi:hypothetical protein